MVPFLKAVVLGIVLAFIVSMFIGSGGSSGGMLNVRHVSASGYHFYWSWALFLIGFGISYGLLLMMD